MSEKKVQPGTEKKQPAFLNFLYQFLRIVLILLFFPLSLVFVAYFKQQKAKKEYFKDEK